MAVPDARSAKGSAPVRKPLGLTRNEGWLAVAGPALLILGCMLYGAMLPQTALAMTLVWAALFGACLARLTLRSELLRVDGLAIPAILFALVIAVALWSLTPLVPGGPHPVWAYLKLSPAAATVDKSATLVEILKLLGLGCVFGVGVLTGGSDNRARLAVNSLLALGAAYGAWAFFAFVLGRGPDATRLEASFMSANTAGTLFAALFVLALGPLASKLRTEGRDRLSKATPFAIAGLLFLVCLFMTASRGAFLGATAALVAFGVLQLLGGPVRLSRAVLFAGGGALAVLALLAVAGDMLLGRLLGDSGDIGSRATIARVHWDAFLTSPLMGFGLGSFDVINRTLLDNATFLHLWSVRAAHNIYLGWLEQGGLLGALPMFGCVAALMLTTVRRGLRRSRATNLIFALVAADVVFLGHGVTDFALEMFAISSLFAYALGLQFSLAQGSSAR